MQTVNVSLWKSKDLSIGVLPLYCDVVLLPADTWSLWLLIFNELLSFYSDKQLSYTNSLQQRVS